MAKPIDVLNATATAANIVSVFATIYDAHARRKKDRQDTDKDRRIKELEAEVQRLRPNPNDRDQHMASCAYLKIPGAAAWSTCDCGVYARWVEEQGRK